MIRPRPRYFLASGILLVGVTGCAGLRRQPPSPMLGPGVAPTPVAATAQPAQAPQATPFAEPGGGIGRFFPGLYPQIKPQTRTASRWVDPFVARNKEKSATEVASVFPQRQPIGLGRNVEPAAEDVESLPVALNIPVHPDDQPVETAQANHWTRRLSARNEPAERPSRWRVSQPKPVPEESDTPPEPMPPQAQRIASPMPDVPRETVAFNLLDASTPAGDGLPALIDPPVATASASETLEVPKKSEPEATVEVPSSEPPPETAPPPSLADEPDPLARTPEPLSPEVDPLAHEPDPLADAPAPVATPDPEPTKVVEVESKPVQAEEPSPNPVAETTPDTPQAVESESPKPTKPVNIVETETAETESSKSAETEAAPAEPVNIAETETEKVAETESPKSAEPETAESAEPETAEPVKTAPSPGTLTEPPPFVPTASPGTPTESEPEDERFAEPPPLTSVPTAIDRSRLPHPPLPSRSMTAVPAVPTSDPATHRIATEVTETALKTKPKADRPARRSLWSRIRGEELVHTPSSPRHHPVPTPGDGLADLPPPQFLPSYYTQSTEAKRDEQTQKISTTPTPTVEKPAHSPWRFRLFRHLRGE